MTQQTKDPLDVLIVGAGISGIGTAYYIQRDCPSKTFQIVEMRDDIGGTWDLFKYPGIRSDSDLYTFAYEFKPWTAKSAIASADSILKYIHEAANENGIYDKVRFQTKVVAAEWSSDTCLWRVTLENTAKAEQEIVFTRWLFSATGYYDYEQGFLPEFEGYDEFQGEKLHPQHWPEQIDLSDKEVVLIGSGATAVTLVPELAEQAKHVVMLQRTPTYMMNLPTTDPIAQIIKKLFSEERAYKLIREKNIFLHRTFWRLCQRFPNFFKKFLVNHVRKQLPKGYDVEKHFTPPYKPWDQRLCAVTDGDLFKAISRGDVTVETDAIERFTAKGIKLASGKELSADVVVTATGLNIKIMGGVDISVDGKPIKFADTVTYKGAMLSDVPNFCFAVGYTNASWTLKIGLLAEYICRVLNLMEQEGFDYCYPHLHGDALETFPLLDFGAGYIQRSLDKMPKRGIVSPWELPMDYKSDTKFFRHGDIRDEFLRFEHKPTQPAAPLKGETDVIVEG